MGKKKYFGQKIFEEKIFRAKNILNKKYFR